MIQQERIEHTVSIKDKVIKVRSTLLKIVSPYWVAVWQMPTGVKIVSQDRSNGEWIPIVDVTRVATWGLIGFSLMFLLIGLLLGDRRS